MQFIAPKGSIVLDGVSLTVNAVKDDTFTVLIIPHTLEVTTLGRLERGVAVNIEADVIGKYVLRSLAVRGTS